MLSILPENAPKPDDKFPFCTVLTLQVMYRSPLNNVIAELGRPRGYSQNWKIVTGGCGCGRGYTFFFFGLWL